MIFNDRRDAGKRLAETLIRFKGKDTIVMALPRGGVVLGAEVAKRLKVPLGVILVRKIGHPHHPEYAIGALVEDQLPIYNQKELAGVDRKWLEKAEKSAHRMIERRREMYFDEDMPQPIIEGSTVLIVDDGIATGFTMQTSIIAMKNKHARHVVAAVPVASSDSLKVLEKLADELIVLDDPAEFLGAVGAHYRKFGQVSDEDVRIQLKEASYELYQATA